MVVFLNIEIWTWHFHFRVLGSTLLFLTCNWEDTWKSAFLFFAGNLTFILLKFVAYFFLLLVLIDSKWIHLNSSKAFSKLFSGWQIVIFKFREICFYQFLDYFFTFLCIWFYKIIFGIFSDLSLISLFWCFCLTFGEYLGCYSRLLTFAIPDCSLFFGFCLQIMILIFLMSKNSDCFSLMLTFFKKQRRYSFMVWSRVQWKVIILLYLFLVSQLCGVLLSTTFHLHYIS